MVTTMTVSDREVLTTSEAAEWLSIHWRTLHRLRERGEGPPAYKIGRVYRYRRADVETWLRDQAVERHNRRRAERR